MAGGLGTRLWPMSRLAKPKQFLKIGSNVSLLESTIARLRGLIEHENIFVIGNAAQKHLLTEACAGILPEDNILTEPVGRNTAACIALATEHILSDGDAIISFLPTDHYIDHATAFCAALSHAMDAAEATDNIILVGIKPTKPATGYGYLCVDHPDFSGVSRVQKFTEKPDAVTANIYFHDARYYWNSGMFTAKASVMQATIKAHLPLTQMAASAVFEAMQDGRVEDGCKVYSALQSISLDYGVLEKCGNLAAVTGAFGWNDIGSFDALCTLVDADADGNRLLAGSLVTERSHNNTVRSPNKLVALIDVDDLIVVDTEDVLYICRAGSSEKTREIINKLSESERQEFL